MTKPEQLSLPPGSVAFLMRSDQELCEFAAITAVGMCRALRLGAVDYEYACNRLFGPALLSRLRLGGAPQNLLDAIHLATELEDVQRLVPHQLEESLREVEEGCERALREIHPRGAEGKWLVVNQSERGPKGDGHVPVDEDEL